MRYIGVFMYNVTCGTFTMNFLKKKEKKTEKKRIGDLGEDIACKFLKRRGFRVLERNYWKKCGEIDIIAKKDNEIHFVEVKSVSCKTSESDVLHETDQHRPEDNVHHAKLLRLSRAIQCYLDERGVPYETDWQIDVVTVRIFMDKRNAKVAMIENVIFE